jgi:hypothetical protein
MHGYGIVDVNNDDSIVSYRELMANFRAVYAATQESMKSQGTMIASMHGAVASNATVLHGARATAPSRHLHIAAATARPPRYVALTFNGQQKKSSPNVVSTAWRISCQPMLVAATHPVQDV